MKTREDELRELREKEEKSQKWVYGIMVVCLVLTFLFMIFDARGDDTTTIVKPDGKIVTCIDDGSGIIYCY